MQLFAEPLLFDDNPASAFGGAGREFQTLALYVYEVAFRNLKFGYAATITWVMFLIVVLVTLVNLAVTRRIGGRE
jgi:cellobiose transport system permease protein